MITAAQIWAQREPPSEMVWEVCPYLRDKECAHCPVHRIIPGAEEYGPMQSGCYGLAAEVCRIVFAMLDGIPP